MACCYCINNPDWLTCPNCKCSGGREKPDEEDDFFLPYSSYLEEDLEENQNLFIDSIEINNITINENNMDNLLELIKENGLLVYEESGVYVIQLNTSNTSIYFTQNGGNEYYTRYSLSKEDKTYISLIERLTKINRVEKKIENEYLPIWTIEDGLIENNEKFIRIKGKLYTIRFIENIFDKISEFKKINL